MSVENPVSGPHMESPQEGGALFYRCESCDREGIGSPENVLHTEDCTEGNR